MAGPELTRRGVLAAALAAGTAVLLPGGAAGAARRALPDPVGSLVTRWDVDPWSRGAYSALPPGVPASVRQGIARSLAGGRVAFAGEYADSAHPATVPGALRSGRAAARLLDEGPGVRGRRVAVIGGGIAGLAAATELARLGADPVVVEARARVGGRVRTDRAWGVPVELGAAWLHGVATNAMTPLVARAGLGRVPTDYADESVRSTATGRRDPAAAARAEQLVSLVDALERQDPPLALSVGAWLAAQGWPEDATGDWAVQTEVVQEYGVDAPDLGTRAVTEGAWDRGGDAFVTGGYDRVARMLAAPLDVRLSSPVSRVDAGSAGVRITTRAGDAAVADLAVVAVPLALLRAGVPAVTPLPTGAATAIARLATGDLEKVALRFPRPWWREDFGDRVRVIGIVGGRWTEWYDITDVTGVPSLVGFCGGSAARRRPATAAGVVAEAMGELRAAYVG